MRSMWTTASPIRLADRTLTDQEPWWHQFMEEFYHLCDGAVDGDWLTVICNALHPLALNDDPRQMARPAYAMLAFDRPEPVKAKYGKSMHRLHTAAPRAMRRTCRR